jgi:calcineurin-like phosphoesterase family protein
MIFWTADTHFNHSGVIRMSQRPFISVDEMNEEIIKRWNERVRPKDEVWHLGDFALGDRQRINEIVERLNGRIHICWGNHDHRQTRKLTCFASSQYVAQIKVGDDMVFMSHYAHRVWNKSHYGSYHVYGHSHGGCLPLGRSLDVGVDCWDFMPVTFEEIKSRLMECGTISDFRNHHPSDDKVEL